MSNTDLIARLNDALPKANEPEARFTVAETSDVREAADALTDLQKQVAEQAREIEALREALQLAVTSLRAHGVDELDGAFLQCQHAMQSGKAAQG